MYSVLRSYGLNGLTGFAVAVEADISGGLPAFSLVGLPDSAVRESGDRVRAAVKNLGFKWPDRHITVNLAPADASASLKRAISHCWASTTRTSSRIEVAYGSRMPGSRPYAWKAAAAA